METSSRKEQQKPHLCVITDTGADREGEREGEKTTAQKVQQAEDKGKSEIRTDDLKRQSEPR